VAEIVVTEDLSEKTVWRRGRVRIGIVLLIAAVIGAFGGWAVLFINLEPPALSVMMRNGIVFTVCVGFPGLSPAWFVKPTALVGERRYGEPLAPGIADLNPLNGESVVARYVLRVGVIVGLTLLVVLSSFAWVMMEDKSWRFCSRYSETCSTLPVLRIRIPSGAKRIRSKWLMNLSYGA
jgi:uncharacterized membrane protein YfcA